MRKSFICIFLVLVFLFTLSFSVYADLPEDDIRRQVVVNDFFLTAGGSTYTSSDSFGFNTGRLLLFDIVHPEGVTQFGYRATFTIDLVTPADIYFFTTSSTFSTTNGSLIPVNYINRTQGIGYDKSALADLVSYVDFSYTGSFLVYEGVIDSSSNTISFAYHSSRTLSDVVTFGKLSVSSGNQSFTLESAYHSNDGRSVFPFGLFVDYHNTGDPILDFENGYLTFDQANDQIITDMDFVLDSDTATDLEKQFAVSVADQQLIRLQAASDSRYSALVNDFSDSSSDIVQSFIDSGSIDILPSLSDLNTLFSDLLTQANSPEQGNLINSLYNVRLSQMQAVFHANYAASLDNVISDEEMSDKSDSLNNIQDLIDIESSTLQIFEESEYQSYLQFSEWISNIDTDNLVPYRSLFDFLFSDDRASVLEPFLHIPFSLVLVGVILATTSAVSRARRR